MKRVYKSLSLEAGHSFHLQHKRSVIYILTKVLVTTSDTFLVTHFAVAVLFLQYRNC